MLANREKKCREKQPTLQLNSTQLNSKNSGVLLWWWSCVVQATWPDRGGSMRLIIVGGDRWIHSAWCNNALTAGTITNRNIIQVHIRLLLPEVGLRIVMSECECECESIVWNDWNDSGLRSSVVAWWKWYTQDLVKDENCEMFYCTGRPMMPRSDGSAQRKKTT